MSIQRSHSARIYNFGGSYVQEIWYKNNKHKWQEKNMLIYATNLYYYGPMILIPKLAQTVYVCTLRLYSRCYQLEIKVFNSSPTRYATLKPTQRMHDKNFLFQRIKVKRVGPHSSFHSPICRISPSLLWKWSFKRKYANSIGFTLVCPSTYREWREQRSRRFGRLCSIGASFWGWKSLLRSNNERFIWGASKLIFSFKSFCVLDKL